MADSDKTLKLLIELGVIGKEDAEAARDLLAGMGKSAEESTGAMEHIPESWAKIGEATKEASTQAEHSEVSHRALHMALHKLNEIVPGLGSSLALLAGGYTQAGKAAENAGKSAASGMITAAGPITILLLAIEAAVTWYKFLTEHARGAGEASAEAFKAADESSRNALKNMQDYLAALDKARGADDDYRAGLSRVNAVLDAQVEAQKKVLKAMEATELAGAKSEDQKKQIRQKYADIEGDVDKKAAAERVKNIQDALARIAADEKKAMDKKEDLEIARGIAYHNSVFGMNETARGEAQQKVEQIDKQLKAVQDAIVKLETDKTKLTTEAGNLGQIGAIKNKGDLDAAIAGGDRAAAVKGIADIVSAGNVASEGQKAFLLEFADDLGHRLGQLKADKNFTSASAAAAYIENYFKTQSDPYGAIFSQIQSAIVAGKAGQDRMAAMWEARFEALQRQLATQRNTQASG